MKVSLLPGHHSASSFRLVGFALFCALSAIFFWSETLYAQAPRNFRIPPLDILDFESSEAEVEAEAGSLPEKGKVTRKVIIDSDVGVDDAAAIIWLLSQPRFDVKVKAIVTVAGATNVDQAVNNAHLLLGWLDNEKTKVVRGSEAPIVQPLSLTPMFIHGVDGLWFIGGPPVAADLPDATAFYCNNLADDPLVIALGPLTNIGKAMDGANGGCPEAWDGVEIISLGGSQVGGNQTPVTEYNYWQDPEAVELLLANGQANGASVQMVTFDAFSQFTFTRSDFRQLDRRGNDAIQNLLPALDLYMLSFEAQEQVVRLPDPAAAIYALANRLGTPQSALVKALAGPGIPEVARGETIIGLGVNERVTMIATDAELSAIAPQAVTDPNFDLEGFTFDILSRQPDNASVVLDIDARRMHNLFIQGLRADTSLTSSGEGTEQSDYDNHLFVPFVIEEEAIP